MYNDLPNKFHAIYIIHSTTGAELISQQYTERAIDVDLITGMFRALEIFINHMAYSQSFERLEEINFRGLSIVYERYGIEPDTVLCVGICDRDFHSEYSHAILSHLVKDFYHRYESGIINFKGSVAQFQEFMPTLNQLNRRTPIMNEMPSSILNSRLNQLNKY